MLLLPASFRSSEVVEVTTPLKLLASLCRFYDLIYPVATFRLVQLLCYHQRTSSKRIAFSALQGLPHVKHDLTHLPETLIVLKEDRQRLLRDENEDKMLQSKEFELFEDRIASRFFLCKIAHQYYDMLDNLLMTPLTLARLNNAIETGKTFHKRLTEVQKADIFKRLLSAWIQVKLREYRKKHEIRSVEILNEDEKKEVEENEAVQQPLLQQAEESIDIGSDWIRELRPDGFNGFHFMQHITEEIRNRKERRIVQICNHIKSAGGDGKEIEQEKKELNGILKGEVPILAGKDDIPVSVV
eukprot:CAMPEP_0197081696 /NCGR_PEP_ID=MMETSP1384-20130603/214766_1 /TAXON_ID=29189 /ORGANISM="Ammonia sp." /LENGTH=298 /DNA_ID=CAMNT_0042520593 /DNA_START=1 /DNA_END=893 /DNA_ORIENTATION=-